ncbi:molybdate ABC transporter substrate-binding protein [Actinoplanes sp. CA-252034]|uniref:molybdate ABC transporter substrate-binding protein n=1 Tax=Actinoplanes sp. CA-252034 TaxID=3239906 RepID=UPI003D96ABB9
MIAVLLAGVLAAGGCAGTESTGNPAGPSGAAGRHDDTGAGDGSGPGGSTGTGNGSGGSTGAGQGPQAGLIELRVAVDESLAQAFVQVEQGFEAHHPNIEVVVSYGEGSNLADRVAGGEPADVFVTDDPFAARGLRLAADPVEVGRVSLVLVKPGAGEELVTFVRDGDGRRILIETGLLRP